MPRPDAISHQQPQMAEHFFRMDKESDHIQHGLTRLLVVDDNPRLLASLCSQLRDQGFQVDHAHDGRAALSQVLARSYDLMLLD